MNRSAASTMSKKRAAYDFGSDKRRLGELAATLLEPSPFHQAPSANLFGQSSFPFDESSFRQAPPAILFGQSSFPFDESSFRQAPPPILFEQSSFLFDESSFRQAPPPFLQAAPPLLLGQSRFTKLRRRSVRAGVVTSSCTCSRESNFPRTECKKSNRHSARRTSNSASSDSDT